ncbi:MAG: Gfo/Idh/MocA family oxidoreductase, partial [Planctomycetota bacterium]
MQKDPPVPTSPEVAWPKVTWPDVPYEPRDPVGPPPGIAVIGCGGISRHHLQAYRDADYPVLALCDLDRKLAVAQRDKFYPEAVATDDDAEALAVTGVAIADITTHPEPRAALIEQAVRAGKHVLSQKPFVLDLAAGERLADLADEHGVRLAVNQNARWAPHFSYLRTAAATGLLGKVHAAHFAVHWDHSWTAGTPFEEIRHLILYDYAIHWFDLLACIMADEEPARVYASFTRSETQTARAALLAQVAVEYPSAQATLVFDGHSPAGEHATAVLVGEQAIARSEGRGDNEHQVVVTTPAGDFQPKLVGRWFD